MSPSVRASPSILSDDLPPRSVGIGAPPLVLAPPALGIGGLVSDVDAARSMRSRSGSGAGGSGAAAAGTPSVAISRTHCTGARQRPPAALLQEHRRAVGELAEMTKAEMGLLNSADQPGAYAIDYCDGLDELLQVR